MVKRYVKQLLTYINLSSYRSIPVGFVCIHDPQGLATKILPKYFRHSNFSSFQVSDDSF